MKKRTLSKVVAVFLAALMTLTMLPMSAFAAVSFDDSKLTEGDLLVSKTDYQIAPGIEETHLVVNNAKGTDQNHIHAMTVDINNGTASLIASYKDQDGTKFGLQTVTDQAKAAEAKRGVNVVGGVNGDIFNMQTGATSGMLIMDGVLYNHHGNANPTNGRPYFAILKDGTAVIREANEPYDDVKEAIGLWEISVKDGKNVSGANGSYNVDPQPRVAVGIKADGSVVVLENDGRQDPYSLGMSWSEIADALIALGCVIGGQLDGGGSATFVSKRSGEPALTVKSSPSDGTPRTVSTALLVTSSAKPDGVFSTAVLEPNNEIYTPGSQVQFTATGADSSGAAVALPEDGVFALADPSFGSITEDGLFTANEKTGTVTVNYISGGEVCGEVSIEIQNPDTFYVPSSEVSLGFEETTTFGIVAQYKTRTVNMKAGDIIWSMVDDNGTDVSTTAGRFDGLTFTTSDGVTVNANVTATYAFDSEIKATIRAIIGAMPVVLYDFEYTTDPEEAENNPELELLPSYEFPNYDRSWEGTYAEFGQQCYEQGYPFFNWPTTLLTDDHAMRSRIVSKEDGEPVRFGDHSLRIDYNYESTTSGGNVNAYLRVAEPSFMFEGTPTAIGCWVYVPEGTADFILALECSNKNGASTYSWVPDDQGMTWSGWKYIEMSLTDENPAVSGGGSANAPYGITQGRGLLWISYWPGAGKGDLTANHIYVDNFQLVYGANTDDILNPEITSIRTDAAEIQDGVTVLPSNTNTFRASYRDVDDKYMTGINFDEVKMYVDGVDVTKQCYINKGDEEIYFYDLNLADGEHRIEISVADIFGNVTTEARTFTIAGEEESNVVSFIGLDESPVLGEDYTMAVVAENAEDILSADVSMKVLSNFPSYWADLRVEPGQGYQLVSPAAYDATTTTLNFAVERDASQQVADDGVIARIIAAIPANMPQGLEVTYRIDKGALTVADLSHPETFVAGFSGCITTTCVSPLVLTTDTMLVGADGGYIYVKDLDDQPVENVEIYNNSNSTLIGTTDADGKLWTSDFVSSVAAFSIYAKKGDQLSFVYTSQSFPCGATEDGMPTFVKLNAAKDPATTQNISWMSSPLHSVAVAVVQYATAADYAEKGTEALTTFTGNSSVSEMTGTSTVATNYAVRLNSALLTGLTPNTEYVYFVGDGEKMTTEPKTFFTSGGNQDTSFFIIGDTQATDTTNTSLISQSLSNSGIAFDFGIQTGDAIDSGGNYKMWEGIASIFSDDFLGKQDMIHVLGNHEYAGNEGTASNSALYFNFPGVENNTAPLYYSVEYGNVYIAVINDGTYALSDLEKAADWLVQDAAASDATWKVLTVHRPAYSTNPGGGADANRAVLSNAVDEAGIDFVFSGHDHSYARTAPLTNGVVDEANGTVYFVCGSTGEKSYPVDPIAAQSFEIATNNYNAVYLTAKTTDTTFEVTAYDLQVDGTANIMDTYTMRKDITCTENNTHDYEYDSINHKLVCSVCGYTTDVGTYSGFITDLTNGKKLYLYLGAPRTNAWQTEGDPATGINYYYLDENGYVTTGKAEITEAITTARVEVRDFLFDGKPTTLTYEFDDEGKLIRGADVYQNDARYYVYAGVLQYGWWNIDGDWYRFDGVRTEAQYGKMLTGEWTRDSQRFVCDDDGKLIQGFVFEDSVGTRYYWAEDYVTGWCDVNGVYWDASRADLVGKRYFDPETGYMVTDQAEIDGVLYLFNEDGTVKNGFIELDGGKVYCDNGAVLTGWQEIDGEKYYFDPANSNYAVTDEITIDGVVYAFNSDGEFQHEGSHLDADGDGDCDLCKDGLLDIFVRILNYFTRILNILSEILSAF